MPQIGYCAVCGEPIGMPEVVYGGDWQLQTYHYASPDILAQCYPPGTVVGWIAGSSRKCENAPHHIVPFKPCNGESLCVGEMR